MPAGYFYVHIREKAVRMHVRSIHKRKQGRTIESSATRWFFLLNQIFEIFTGQ